MYTFRVDCAIGRTFRLSSFGGSGLKGGTPIGIGLAIVTVGFTLVKVVGASPVGPETIMGFMVLGNRRCSVLSLSIAA